MPKSRYSDDQLFQMYVTLGEERTLKRLSEVTGYSLQTLNNKSSKGNWKSRLADLTEKNESLITAFVADIKNEVAISEAVVYRGASEKLLSILQESMHMLQPTGNPREIKTILDTYKLINGQPTEITKQEVSTINTETLTDEELDAVTTQAYQKLFGAEA